MHAMLIMVVCAEVSYYSLCNMIVVEAIVFLSYC